MLIAIRHELRFSPPAGASNAVSHLLLSPAREGQSVRDWAIDMPGIEAAARFTDAYGNAAHLVNQLRPEGEMVVVARGTVETVDRHGVLGRGGAGPVPALYRRPTATTKRPAALMDRLEPKGSALDKLHALMGLLGESSPAQSQTQSGGKQSQSQGGSALGVVERVEQFIGAARALDIPARFVTGYLLEPPEGIEEWHAWAEAHDDRLGWIGFDPALQLCTTDRHVRLAMGLDADTTRPLRCVPAADIVQTVGVAEA
jgi:hypothetical protein